MSTRKPPTTMTRLKGVRNPPPIRRRPVSMVRVCPNTSCTDPHIEDVDDKRVCTACGTVVSDSNIVSEVQFGETSTGAAVVQGSYIGADQSHARTTETGFRRGGGMDSREITDANGRCDSVFHTSKKGLTAGIDHRETIYQSVGGRFAYSPGDCRYGVPGLQIGGLS